MYDAGEDTQFGKEAYRMMKLDTPPYYGVRQTGMLLYTLDGICINDSMQALDAERKVIPASIWSATTAADSMPTPTPTI